MKKLGLVALGLAVAFGLGSCGNSTGSSLEESGDSCANDSADAGYVADADAGEGEDDSGMETGFPPYQVSHLEGDDSYIKVKAPDSRDVVAIVKLDGDMVRTVFIRAGDSDGIEVPNDTYEVFFYEGNGWTWKKHMPDGNAGGFVDNECFLKGGPLTLKDQVVSYNLESPATGKYPVEQSDAGECF